MMKVSALFLYLSLPFALGRIGKEKRQTKVNANETVFFATNEVRFRRNGKVLLAFILATGYLCLVSL